MSAYYHKKPIYEWTDGNEPATLPPAWYEIGRKLDNAGDFIKDKFNGLQQFFAGPQTPEERQEAIQRFRDSAYSNPELADALDYGHREQEKREAAQPFYTKINPYYAAAAAGGIPVALAGAYAAKRYFDSKKNK